MPIDVYAYVSLSIFPESRTWQLRHGSSGDPSDPVCNALWNLTSALWLGQGSGGSFTCCWFVRSPAIQFGCAEFTYISLKYTLKDGHNLTPRRARVLLGIYKMQLKINELKDHTPFLHIRGMMLMVVHVAIEFSTRKKGAPCAEKSAKRVSGLVHQEVSTSFLFYTQLAFGQASCFMIGGTGGAHKYS